MRGKTILYAPNIHVGGGFVLLQALLRSLPPGMMLSIFLDERGRNQLVVPSGVDIKWVKATIKSRLLAELMLMQISKQAENILCFHGLPPLMPTHAKVLVFLQNRNYLGLNSVSQFKLNTRFRLHLERFISMHFRNRVTKYIIQTPSMQRNLIEWYTKLGGVVPQIEMIPLFDNLPILTSKEKEQKKWDFVYVADGEGHKNHSNLLKAWKILANENIRPSLALTLSSRDLVLKNLVTKCRNEYGLQIFDLGEMSRDDLFKVYLSSKAMVFPSKSESFGLPLIEAVQLGLPIVASELDFVRDICEPKHTFDPESPISIARAVKRFMGIEEKPIKLLTSEKFWDLIF